MNIIAKYDANRNLKSSYQVSETFMQWNGSDVKVSSSEPQMKLPFSPSYPSLTDMHIFSNRSYSNKFYQKDSGE